MNWEGKIVADTREAKKAVGYFNVSRLWSRCRICGYVTLYRWAESGKKHTEETKHNNWHDTYLPEGRIVCV